MRLTPDKKLHSREHLLADDLSKMLLEPKRFAGYLGLAVLYDEGDLRGLARRVLEKKDLPLEARGKYFFAATKGLMRKPGAKLKNTKRKNKILRQACLPDRQAQDKKSRINKNARKNKTHRKRS